MSPRAPAHPCAQPGCKALIEGRSRCDEHDTTKQHYQQHPRGSSTQQGYGARWRTARKHFLTAFRFCVVCREPSTVVDHVEPHKGDTVKFWDPDNWQAMCKRCHDSKTAREDGRWGR